ncbi:MAG TPA: ABC transporter permease [Vicinamibacterales bacterium]|nr:ABC transporter permease [Vicinamibacterales bacterium]
MTREVTVTRWALGRLLVALPVVLGVTTLTFVLIHVAPGDPIYLLAGDGGSPAYYAEMRAKYGLDRPLAEQFVRYIRAVATGDLGYSFMFQSPVLRLLLDHAAASLLLGFAALVLGSAVGFGAAVLCVVTQSRGLDALVRGAATVAYAAPVFWTGQIFILIAAVKLGWLPVGGMSSARETLVGVEWMVDVARHLLLPAVTLALPLAAVVARVSLASLIEGLRETHVLATYARGLSRARVIGRHVIPNALVPVTALVGQHAADIVAGAALTEALFGWPGVGYLVLHGSLHRDYPLVTAAFILISTSVVMFNALSDAAIAWLDPRIRLR